MAYIKHCINAMNIFTQAKKRKNNTPLTGKMNNAISIDKKVKYFRLSSDQGKISSTVRETNVL